MMRVLQLVSTVAVAASLVACGGGGTATTTNTLTGFFIDSPVEGLTYTTDTQAGTTAEDGSFNYIEGEDVTFKLYGLTISSPPGYTYLTPFDLSDNSISPSYSINLIRFLLTIDEDENPDNGITLPDYSGSLDLNFNKTLRDFENDTDGKVANFLTNNANGRILVSIQDAISHFNNSIENINPNYILSFAGRNATASTINTSCINNVLATMQYTFSDISMQINGSDGFFNNGDGNCIVSDATTEEISYSSIPSGDLFDCLPACTYKQLNSVSYVSEDVDGRTTVISSWHTPNSNEITTFQEILADPDNNNDPASLITFIDRIVIN